MKLLTSFLLIFLSANFIYSQENGTFSNGKHEIAIKTSYGRTPISSVTDDTIFHVRYDIEADNNINSLIDTFVIKDLKVNSIGLSIQYNRLFNKHLFLPVSLNINYSFPKTVIDYNRNLFSDPVFTAFENSSSVYMDVGLGCILWDKNKTHLRIASGFLLGHFTALDMISPISVVYDNSTIARGFNMEYIRSFMIGGCVDASLNIPIKEDKLDIALNYKFSTTKGVGNGFRDVGFFNHNLGLGLNIKL